MKKLIVFYYFIFFVIICYPLYSQNTSDNAIISADCGVDDFIAFYTYKDVSDMWGNNNSRYFFNRNKKTRRLENIVINAEQPTIVYFMSKKISQQCPIYLNKGDSIKVISKNEKDDFVFYGRKEDEWNFYNKSRNAGYPTMGERWKFDFSSKKEFLISIISKRNKFISYLKFSKKSSSLSDDFLLKFSKDAHYSLIWSVIETYESNWKNKSDTEFFLFVKNYESSFFNKNTHKSWPYYMALYTWNKFLTKYYYKTGETSEKQFDTAQKLESNARDELSFLILTTQENWSSLKEYNRCTEIFKQNCKNSTLLAKFILKSYSSKQDKSELVTEKKLRFSPVYTELGQTITWESVINKNKGKVILIDLWASWCGPCRTQLIDFQKLYNSSPEKFQDIALVNISIDQNRKSWKKAMNDLKIDTNKYQNILIDPKSVLARNILPDGAVPRYIIIDRKGVIRTKNSPRPNSITFWAIMETLLKEKI